MNIELLAEKTWNSFYPDRKPWKDVGESAKNEWVGVFKEYDKQRSNANREVMTGLTFQEAVIRMLEGKTMKLFSNSYSILKGVMDTDLRERITLSDLEKSSYDHGDRGCVTEEPELLRNGIPHTFSLVEVLSNGWYQDW